MFGRIKQKIDAYMDSQMLVEHLYEEWMEMPLYKLYDSASYYTVKCSLGEGYRNEVYTYTRVLKARGITPQDLIDAKDAKEVADRLTQ
jgi:hypothetical protein